MWEYDFVEEKNEKKLVKRLDEYGAKNWEACGFAVFPASMSGTRHFVLLKRQKE